MSFIDRRDRKLVRGTTQLRRFEISRFVARCVFENPRDVDRSVALGDVAMNFHALARVRRVVPKRERPYNRSHCRVNNLSNFDHNTPLVGLGGINSLATTTFTIDEKVG